MLLFYVYSAFSLLSGAGVWVLPRVDIVTCLLLSMFCAHGALNELSIVLDQKHGRKDGKE